MKPVLLAVALVGIAGTSWAYEPWQYKKPYKDTWGNSYRYQQNLYKDTDRDGVINKYDYNDTNRFIQSAPSFQNKFEFEYQPRSSHPIKMKQPSYYWIEQ